ncbi:MAG: hypothetical protein AAFP86_07420 [Planctomycetota bacterium]
MGLLLAALGVYTVALLWIEFATSQAHVRHYFSDVETSRPFFAINTTLSVSLLWGTALAFAFAARSAMRRGAQPRPRAGRSGRRRRGGIRCAHGP